MKNSVILLVLGASTLFGCGGKDDGGSGNNPPSGFALLTVANLSSNVDRKPLFTWEAATDPDGDSVVYDLYVQKPAESDQLIAADINGTSYQTTDVLSLIEEYSWFVVAKDGKGGESISQSFLFTTRNITTGLQANPAAGFTQRAFHATFTLGDKLFLLGGTDQLSVDYNDVWSTEDGLLWVNETPSAAFFEGSGFSIVKLGNQLYLIGGNGLLSGYLDDVWTSLDGIAWTQLVSTAPFGARTAPCTILDNKIWLVGGVGTAGFSNDVWISNDGASWNTATLNAAFFSRAAHQLVSFKNKLWVVAGGVPGIIFSDIWSSTDGITWVEETPAAAFGPRAFHKILEYDGKLWLFGGRNDTSNQSSIWYSKDGILWQMAVVNSPALVDRGAFDVTVYKDKFWLTGGNVNGSVKNDVWVFE